MSFRILIESVSVAGAGGRGVVDVVVDPVHSVRGVRHGGRRRRRAAALQDGVAQGARGGGARLEGPTCSRGRGRGETDAARIFVFYII